MPARLLAVVGLCLLVGLAGCAGLGDGSPSDDGATPTPDGSTPTDAATPTPGDATTPDRDSLTVQVTGNGTYTIAVDAVAEDNDGVRVFYTDGSTVTVDGVQSRGDLPDETLDGATRVEPVVDASGASFTMSDGRGGIFGWPAEPSAVVYSVTDGEGRLLGWDYVDCGDGHVAELRIDISGSGNVSAGRSCVS